MPSHGLEHGTDQAKRANGIIFYLKVSSFCISMATLIPLTINTATTDSPTGRWYDVPSHGVRHASASYICETTLSGGSCHSSWREFHGSCYISREASSFSAARSQCAEESRISSADAHLVKVESQEENDFVYGLCHLDLCFIGLSKSTPGMHEGEEDWSWDDGSKPSYTNWADLEPTTGWELWLNTFDEDAAAFVKSLDGQREQGLMSRSWLQMLVKVIVAVSCLVCLFNNCLRTRNHCLVICLGVCDGVCAGVLFVFGSIGILTNVVWREAHDAWTRVARAYLRTITLYITGDCGYIIFLVVCGLLVCHALPRKQSQVVDDSQHRVSVRRPDELQPVVPVVDV
jgi:hypothetical protein